MKKNFTLILFLSFAQLCSAFQSNFNFFNPKLTIQEGYVLDSVRIDNGGTSKSIMSFQYDSSGRLTRYKKGVKTEYYLDSNYTQQTNVFPVFYDVYYNSFGQIEREEGEYFDSAWVPYLTYSYSYNSENRLSEKSFKYSGGSNSFSEYYQYDSSGNLVDYSTENYSSDIKYLFEYDSLNRVTSKKYYDDDSKYFDNFVYQYDSLNNIHCLHQEISVEDSSSVPYSYEAYIEFNEDGNIQYEACKYSSKDNYNWMRIYSYNTDGNFESAKWCLWDNWQSAESYYFPTYVEYDDNKNPFSYSYYSFDEGWVDLTHITIIDSYGNEITLDCYSCEFFCSKLEDNTTDVIESQKKPLGYNLSQNYPNPFNPTTTIAYSVAKSGNVTLEVFDNLGRKINTLVNEYQNAGEYNVAFNGSNLASGIYFYRIKTNDFIMTKKLLLLK